MTEIGYGAFSGCLGLTSIVVAKGNGKYDSRNNCNAIIETATNTLVTGCMNTVIPDSVTEIGEFAFSGFSGLTSINIPDSVTSIGDYAFSGCSGLNSVTIPNSVTSIGEYAFNGCSGLTAINIPDSVTKIGQMAFYDCSGLSAVTIGSGVTSIGSFAFSKTNLISIYFNATNCIYMGENDENYYCYTIFTDQKGEYTSLKEIIIGGNVTNIPDFAFYKCSGVESVIIPDSVKKIGDGAFSLCSKLKSVYIGKSVMCMNHNTFYKCNELESIVVNPENKLIDSRGNCNAIIITDKNTLFIGCKKTVIPNSVTKIGKNAFGGCNNLSSIDIPNSVIEIEGGAFLNCTRLTSIIIPDSVKIIYSSKLYEYDDYYYIGAFKGCSGLTSINIPDSVTKIGRRTFDGCNGLKEIIISKGSREKFEKLLPEDLWNKIVES